MGALGRCYLGISVLDKLALANELLAWARAGNARIAVAESCTGGLIAGAISEAPGASDIFERGFVTYTNTAKIEMLGVSPDTLETFGAVSEEVAQEMAAGALRNSTATIALSITGIAGPGGSEHKPEGRVCFALTNNKRLTIVETVEFGAIGRSQVRAAAVRHGLKMLITALS